MTFNLNFQLLIWFASLVSLFGHELNSSIAKNVSNSEKTMTKILVSLFNNSAYDRRVRPNYGGKPVNVSVLMSITDIDVSDIEMEFTAQIYLRQFWNDYRLSFEPEDGIQELLLIEAEMMDKLWIPNTYFTNAIKAKFHSATVHNSNVRIQSSGRVSKSIRLTLTTDCPMNLQYYPMDHQMCTIGIKSYGYRKRDITYNWFKIKLSPEIEMPEFRVVGQSHHNLSINGGLVSRLEVKIHLKRALGYYLIQIYIPAVLIVVMSWIAFWLNRKATGARVGVGVTTVLTITTLMSTTNSTLPKMSYIKAIDVYLGTCFVNVFSAFVESAIVGYVAKKLEMRVDQRANDKTDKKQTEEVVLTVQNTKLNTNQLFSPQENNIASDPQLFASKTSGNLFDANPSNFDKYSRLLFPVCFLLFNIIYWSVYLNMAPKQYGAFDVEDY